MATKLLTNAVGFQNFYSTNLTSDITNTALDIFLDSVPSPSEGVLIIDPESASLREIIYYTSKTGTKVTCPANGRGYDNTTATSHTAGTTVIMAPVADYFECIKTGQIFAAGFVGTDDVADDAVTPAKWTNPYCFRAYNSASTTLTDGVAVKVAFATEVYDLNNNFASSTYTAPVTGIYHFDGMVTISGPIANGVGAWASLYVNGAETVRGGRYTPISNTGYLVSADISLTAGQTVDLYFFQDSDGNEVTENSALSTWFSGHLVTAT